MIKVVIVNGFPGVGKSKFERMCAECCGVFGREVGFTPDRNLFVDITSTVDFVKEVAFTCGWDGTKTLENRKFLSDLKTLLTEWNDVPNTLIENHIKTLPSTYDWIVFVDCREPAEIQKLKERFNATTILIRRPQVESYEVSNNSDAKVFDYDYDLEITNEYGLEELKMLAEHFIEYMKKEEVPHYVNVD
jgi:tRNA uridine 5-carbamoylmethylation protein Kti12